MMFHRIMFKARKDKVSILEKEVADLQVLLDVKKIDITMLQGHVKILEKRKQEHENKIGAMQNAVLAMMHTCFSLGEKAGMFIRCYKCDVSITLQDGKLPPFDIDKSGFKCMNCVKIDHENIEDN